MEVANFYKDRFIQYLGGKSKIVKDILKVIGKYRNPIKEYIEPFCGACSVISQVNGFANYYASDINRPLISLFQSLQKGWLPPEIVTEEEYYQCKARNDENDPLTAFIGIGCSFGAKWWGGVARNKKGTNYAAVARRSLIKQLPFIKDIYFTCQPYQNLRPVDAVLYLDPPYKGTTNYSYIKTKFDYDEFWQTVREWSKNNVVLTSEYQAPEDFEVIYEFKHKTALRNKEDKRIDRVERIFKYKE